MSTHDPHHAPSVTPDPGARGMSTGSAVIGMFIAAILGFLLGRAVGGGGQSLDAPSPADTEIAVVPPGAVDTAVERYRVPIGSAPVRGSSSAKVTIVIYSDFQCPFCSRVVGTMEQLERTYGRDLRLVFKQNPLAFHQNAMPAAEAALAAHEQKRFWEMHDKLFKNQQALGPQDLERHAKELHLDLAKFKQAISTGKFKQQIQADMAEGARFGVRGTPAFFINGRFLSGAQPYESFKSLVDQEIAAANRAIKAGVAPSQVYAALTKNGKSGNEPPAPQPQRPQPARPDANVAYQALVGDAPVKGSKRAKVTIVEWSDYQCPFCSRVEPTIDRVLTEYPNDVRVAFKQKPLPFHNHAHVAAQAALAAKEQGKFWEMHAKMFANAQALDRPSLERYAAELGMNLAKFKAALDSGKFKQKVDAEIAEGEKIGAGGTPSFFINGKSHVGAQPFESFKAKIDEELRAADAIIAAKRVAPGDALYAEIMKTARASVAAPDPVGAPGDAVKVAAPDPVVKVAAGNGPSRGPANAPVQIVMFSDYQCPFCARVEPTVQKIMDTYQGKVRVTWRDFPLPFHQQAGPAAEAARAAGEQGKFWEMHDKLFSNPHGLDRAAFEKYATELKLDLNKFKSALDSGKFKAVVQADFAYGNSIAPDGMGTPTFFINGHKLAGAYPFEEFAKIIDGELKKK